MVRLALLASCAMVAFCTSGHAATIDVACSGTIDNALKSAINSARDGDTVRVGAGTCTLTNTLGNFNDKNIQIIGAGQGQTKVTADNGIITMTVTGTNDMKFRLSGFSFSSNANPANIILLWGDATVKMKGPFRIDHNDFDYPNQHSGGAWSVWGPLYGLFDHNTVRINGIWLLQGPTVSGEYCSYNYSWQGGPCNYSTLAGGTITATPFDPGGPANIYLEDNTFTNGAGTDIAAIDSGYTGARVVVRNNTLTNAMLYGHWTSSGNLNTSWWEVYHNKFIWTGANGALYPARLQGGGTGLIYENQISGPWANYIMIGEGRNPSQGQSGAPLNFCDGKQPVDGNAGDPAAPGWPCLGQTGRNGAGASVPDIVAGKKKQPSFPLYLWRNGPEATCLNATGTCANSFGVNVYGGQGAYFKSTPHPNGDVDWSKTATKPTGAGTHTLTYTPFAYPYPLNAAGMPDAGGTSPPIEPPPIEQPPPTGDGNATSLFLPTDVPKNPSEADNSSVELGMKFAASKAGNIAGVRFYKGAGNTGSHSGSLWSSTGTRLANVSFTGETDNGWQQMLFTQPVAITANTNYVVSYHSGGRYASDQNYFAQAKTNAPLSAPANAGVFKYGSAPAFPNESWNGTNYWVDVVYAPTDGPPPVTAAPVLYITAQATRGQAFTYQVTASNTPSSFTATGLPAGLTINGTTGVISGTPATTGMSDVTITATNAKGSDTEVLQITVK